MLSLQDQCPFKRMRHHGMSLFSPPLLFSSSLPLSLPFPPAHSLALFLSVSLFQHAQRNGHVRTLTRHPHQKQTLQVKTPCYGSPRCLRHLPSHLTMKEKREEIKKETTEIINFALTQQRSNSYLGVELHRDVWQVYRLQDQYIKINCISIYQQWTMESEFCTDSIIYNSTKRMKYLCKSSKIQIKSVY